MAEIKVTNLKYRYPHTDRLALDGINCEIHAGEFIGIIGRNGSGKSTFCQALTGLVPNFYRGAYGGKVFVDDIEVRHVEVDDLCRKVGIVFQNPFNQVTGSKLTVYEEIAFGLENFGIPRDEMIRRIDRSLEELDIVRFKDRAPFDLSGGQMQRMAIASIIAMEPEVIILDEPTSQLDPQGSEEVFRAVQRLSRQGITIIMAEHKMEKIAAYSDRVMLLDDGKLVDFDAPGAIFSRNDLKEHGVIGAFLYKDMPGTWNKDKREGPISGYPGRGRRASYIRTGGDGMNQIDIKGLHFSYTEKEEILKGINLVIDERPTAIIGQNGAGKTTFVKLLKGLLRPTQGNILFNGQDLSGFTAAQLAKDIGLVFQNPNDQIFKNTVMDEVMFGPLQIGMDRQAAEASAQKALAMVGLEGTEKVNPYDLGLSDRKMVSIAAIIAMDTDAVIFDEPTIAQDYMGKERIKAIMKALNREHKIVISILHDMDFVAETFERAIVFAKGNVLLDGDTRAVFGQKNMLEQAYLEQPGAARLCHELGYSEVFLSPEEFINFKKGKELASPVV